MTNTLTDWDAQIVADMARDIATIERAINAGPNVGDLYRPQIGDARAQTKAHWDGEIAKLRGWIANIQKGA